MKKKIALIGGGPANLMLAARLNPELFDISIYERNKALGRKYLVAGDGGLNLTYQNTSEGLYKQYSPADFMKDAIETLTVEQLREWYDSIGIETFVGSSKRVFPSKEYKPVDVLNAIIKVINENKVDVVTNYLWDGWTKDGYLTFNKHEKVPTDLVVFGLGGASWSVTGSDGKWQETFIEKGVEIDEFIPANCAFQVDWSPKFLSLHEGKPIKNISIESSGIVKRGELVITSFGLEGNAIYAISESIQNKLKSQGIADVFIDFKPMISHRALLNKIDSVSLEQEKRSVTTLLKKTIKLHPAQIALIKQMSTKEEFLDVDNLPTLIKSLELKIVGSATLDEAISTLGGIALDEVDENFELKKLPNHFAIGEMLSWNAPTGGYLLHGSMAMGYKLASYLNDKYKNEI